MNCTIKQLPNEIIMLILTKLNRRKHVFSFLSTCHLFYSLIKDDSFWRDFNARKYGIHYRDPNYSWWQLFASNHASKMCCHINLEYANQILLESKRQLLWQTFCQDTNELCCGNVQFDNYGICMEPNCQFIGCGDIFFEPEAYPGHLRAHYTHTRHNIVLKLSPLNFMELWCYACDSPVSRSHFYHSLYILTAVFIDWLLGTTENGETKLGKVHL